ncbi:MAG: ATPase, T2SS/T4P/T4SS family [Peptococcaceae bacterium]|jgi:pilus assembly protein CpaF|nr:ATPase, T2SS/T4P/T4SS family [Peptococcaceae bacterium]MDH7525821.1 ATPase, T2SS/T4P/T4SS family [Peptococcaceae bacterium]
MPDGLQNQGCFKRIEYEEVLELTTRYLADPPLEAGLKEFHSRMLNNAVRRDPSAREYINLMTDCFLDTGPYLVEGMTREELVRKLFQDMYGLGPIEPLIDDPEIQEVNVNGYNNIWYEKNGLKRRAEGIQFASDEKLKQVIDRCLPDKEVNRLATFAQSNFDNSRIYIGIPPVARVPYLNYRKFSVFTASEEQYLATGTITKEALEILKLLVGHRANITIIGPQNAGKTTLLCFLTDYYPRHFRIGVLESPDFETTIERRRPEGNVFSLKADEKLGVTELDIFKHALRFSADVLIIPEARGAEMEEVLKAQRRGNRGSMTTAHSISPANLVDDMVLMITESGKQYQLDLLKMMVARSLDIVIAMHHFPDGKRKVIGISEVDYEDEQKRVVINEIFRWEKNTLVRTNNVLREELVYSLLFHGASLDELRRKGLV